MEKTFNPCDECGYSHSKQGQESGMCQICEFKRMQESWLDPIEMCKIKIALDRLKEYQGLGQQGKLLKLPIAVGDTVYEVCEGFIEPCTVEVIFIADYKDKEGNSSYMAAINYDRKDCPWVSTEIYLTDIGKTVFFTREEAEAALKELQEQ